MSTGTSSPSPTVPTEERKFRSHIGHISRHSGIFFAGTLFSLLAGYLFKVYLARVLGAEALGIYALGMTLVGFFSVFNALGLPESAVRFVSAYTASGEFEKLRSFLWRGTGILLASNAAFVALFFLVGSWIARHFYHSEALPKYLSLFAVILLSSALRTFFEKAMAGYRNVSRRTLIVNFIGTPATILVSVALISLGTGLRGYLYAQIVSSIVVVTLLIIAIWEQTPVAARFSRAPLLPMERQVWWFSATIYGMSFLGFLLAQADKITLGYFLGPRDVGIYAVAAALVAYVPIVLQSVNQMFAPTISDLRTRGDHEVLGRLFQTLTKWIIALTVPLAIVMIRFARPLMHVFGPEFEIGWPILIIGTCGQLVNVGVGSVGYMLVMSGHERRVITVQGVMAGLMVFLNIFLVPVWGIYGAAVAGALTTVGTNVWFLLEVKTALRLSPYNRSYIKLVLPTIATCPAVWLVRLNSFNVASIAFIVMVLMLSYTVFLGMFLAFGLTEDDRMIVATARQRLQGLLAR